MRKRFLAWNGRDRAKQVASSKRLREQAILPFTEPEPEPYVASTLYQYGRFPPAIKATRSFNARGKRRQLKPNAEGMKARSKFVAGRLERWAGIEREKENAKLAERAAREEEWKLEEVKTQSRIEAAKQEAEHAAWRRMMKDAENLPLIYGGKNG